MHRLIQLIEKVHHARVQSLAEMEDRSLNAVAVEAENNLVLHHKERLDGKTAAADRTAGHIQRVLDIRERLFGGELE